MPPNRFESEVESFLEGSHGDRTHIKRADHPRLHHYAGRYSIRVVHALAWPPAPLPLKSLTPMTLSTNIGQIPANEKTPDLSNPELKWSGRRESNPPLKLGKLPFYR